MSSPRKSEDHIRRRVHRLRAVLNSSGLSQRLVEKNVRLLKRCALTLLRTEVADKTRQAYWRCYRRRCKAGMLDPAATPNGLPPTRRGWYYNRASLQFGIATDLLAWLNTPAEVQQEAFVRDYEPKAECIEWLRRLNQVLQVAPPGIKIGALHSTLASSQSQSKAKINAKPMPAVQVPRPAKFAQSTSKRVGLASLRRSWRARFWKNVKPAARYRTHMAALVLTGARPCEFEEGIRVRYESSPGGERLVFLIRGRKLSDTTGLAWRRIFVDVRAALNDPNRAEAVAHLVTQLRHQPRQRLDVKCGAKALHAAVSAVGKRAFPRHGYKVAPYSFRHQLATDINVADLDEVEFARILSHASTRTAEHYGYADRSRGVLMRPKSLPIRSGGARGQVRIKHSAPPSWPLVRSRSTPIGRSRRKKP
ncbi:MAG: hypothetical protein QUV35_08060 [Hydrogenophaga sp.]|uniref:hypothetical protein n=1 Tax=Hydrogenophaga sp. TaxID=1904254 RepID=UPI00262B8793|nr:hypothetical protein [Hydrogenophaga sp.]MDM7942568.1 hypothetical protein [Hydrogenophaga sp.]